MMQVDIVSKSDATGTTRLGYYPRTDKGAQLPLTLLNPENPPASGEDGIIQDAHPIQLESGGEILISQTPEQLKISKSLLILVIFPNCWGGECDTRAIEKMAPKVLSEVAGSTPQQIWRNNKKLLFVFRPENILGVDAQGDAGTESFIIKNADGELVVRKFRDWLIEAECETNRRKIKKGFKYI